MKYTVADVFISGTSASRTKATMPHHKAVLFAAGSGILTFTGKIVGSTGATFETGDITILTPANNSQLLPIQFSSFTVLTQSAGTGYITLLN